MSSGQDAREREVRVDVTSDRRVDLSPGVSTAEGYLWRDSNRHQPRSRQQGVGHIQGGWDGEDVDIEQQLEMDELKHQLRGLESDQTTRQYVRLWV